MYYYFYDVLTYTYIYLQRSIHFSILSPRRRPKLFKLFKRVSNPVLPMTNYAVEGRHHILIDSIVLKGRQPCHARLER